MTRKEHLQFLALLIPTFLLLGAAALSMAEPAIEFLCSPAQVAAAPQIASPEEPRSPVVH